MPVSELLTLTLVELCDTLRARRASPVELMRAVLARIDETNGDLNAICSRRDPDACLADARASEARILRGEGRPLEGIPLGVKELEHAAGLPATEASPLFAERVAADDSVQVARLKAAGAIVVGKTNAPEFGAPAYTKNRIYGVTRSPWNLELSPGGSSGGSSAAMAAAVLPLVTASDGGGSIRIPASFTGCFGLKTSFGRIPHEPEDLWEYGATAVYGPLTKTVADAALFLDQVAGFSALDPYSLPAPGFSYAARVAEPLPSGLRIGFSPDLGYAVVQSDVAEIVEEAVGVLGSLGHRVSRLEGGPPELGRPWGLLGAFLLGARLHEHLEGREELVGRGLLAGFKTTTQMSQMQWAALGEAAGRLERLVRRRVRSLRPAGHAHRPLRSLPRSGPLSHGDRRPTPAVVERRLVHHSLQPLLASGGHRTGRYVAARASRRHADRRPATPRRSRAAGSARLRARAPVASSLASGLVSQYCLVRHSTNRSRNPALNAPATMLGDHS